eukprot:TRINITY_DN6640_c0_g1_i1.p1 TRINITY_DN6640_c0_g1~~TRINITY_DN6640_c0_g1_i1.p1  ORF type:complete len:967 (+),score=154.15 TRINITY_DN6640_c0_g1_i1:6-2906(+)
MCLAWLLVLVAAVASRVVREVSIRTCQELQSINEYLANASPEDAFRFVLRADIDCQPIGFAPLGNAMRKFRHEFDGRGHVIRNLNILGIGHDYVGLFGFASAPAVLHNFVLVSPVVVGRGFVGTVCGYAASVSLENIIVESPIVRCSELYAGGFVGVLTGSKLAPARAIHCHVRYGGSVSVDEAVAGGFAGYADRAQFESCSSAATVSGGLAVGGFVGSSVGSRFSRSWVASSQVQATPNRNGCAQIGGFVGDAETEASAFSRCAVFETSVRGGSRTGGFAGLLSAGSVVVDCVTTGAVTAMTEPVCVPPVQIIGGFYPPPPGIASFVGAAGESRLESSFSGALSTQPLSCFVGRFLGNETHSSQLSHCFCHAVASAVIGPTLSLVVSDADLRSGEPFDGWDTHIWNFSPGLHPFLVFETTTLVSAVPGGYLTFKASSDVFQEPIPLGAYFVVESLEPCNIPVLKNVVALGCPFSIWVEDHTGRRLSPKRAENACLEAVISVSEEVEEEYGAESDGLSVSLHYLKDSDELVHSPARVSLASMNAPTSSWPHPSTICEGESSVRRSAKDKTTKELLTMIPPTGTFLLARRSQIEPLVLTDIHKLTERAVDEQPITLVVSKQNYLPDTYTQWVFRTQQVGCNVRFQLHTMDSELGEDILAVFSGKSSSGPLLMGWSGRSLPAVTLVQSSGQVMTVRFTSNENSVVGHGFSATVSRTCSNRESSPNNRAIYYIGDFIPPISSQILIKQSQVGTYVNNLSWVARLTAADPTCSLSFNIVSFDTFLNSDFLTISSPSTNSTMLSWSGRSTPFPMSFVSPSHECLISFTSDSSGADGGFSITIQPSCSGSKIPTFYPGDVIPPFVEEFRIKLVESGEYQNNMNVSWTFSRKYNASECFKLKWGPFHTQENDNLGLVSLSGSQKTDILIGWSGDWSPPEISSRAQTLMLSFVSDAENTGRGFTLNVSIAPCSR